MAIGDETIQFSIELGYKVDCGFDVRNSRPGTVVIRDALRERRNFHSNFPRPDVQVSIRRIFSDSRRSAKFPFKRGDDKFLVITQLRESCHGSLEIVWCEHSRSVQSRATSSRLSLRLIAPRR